MHSPTQSEFDNLPATVQRKCFSTLERLRYAETQAQIQVKATTATQPPLASYLNPKKLLQSRHTSLTKIKNTIQAAKLLRSSSSPSQHRPSNITCTTVTPEDALWFSRLPEKIQRGQFSAEEQILLAPRKEDVILDAADEKFYKLGEQIGNRSLPSLSSHYTGPSSADSFDLEDHGSVLSEENSMDSQKVLDTFRWLDAGTDLSLHDYHVHLTKEAETTVTPVPGATLRKQKSFTSSFLSREARSPSIVSRRSTEHCRTRWASTDVPPVPRIPASLLPLSKPALGDFNSHELTKFASITPQNSEMWGPGWALMSTAPKSPPDGAASLMEAEATHYLDPEARLKLKHYLASPSKFDEALEFGFPSLKSPPPSRHSFSSRRPSTSTARSVHHRTTPKDLSSNPTFLDDATTITDSVEHPADVESQFDLSPQLSGSSTPLARDHISSPETAVSFGDTSIQPFSLSVARSRIHTETQAQARNFEAEPYHRAWPNREMTLKMTLTRPDLRSDNPTLCSARPTPASRRSFLKRSMSVKENLGKANSYGNGDPLKTEDLHFGDNVTNVGFRKEKHTAPQRLWIRREPSSCLASLR